MEQVDEAGLELSFDHVVVLDSDAELFKSALHEFNCKGKKRPTLATVDFGYVPQNESLKLASIERPSTASSSLAHEEVSVEDEGPVEVEPVGVFTIRTNSSLGFPENQY